MTDVISGPIFFASRDPDPGWVTALAERFQRQLNVNWPKLVWMPGEWYEPVQRWVIYEMLPRLDLINELWILDIQGDDPRNRGRWIPDDSVPGGKRWWSEAFVSHLQWELFRETNCYPALYWIIQGDQGGHKWRLTPQEKQLLRLNGCRVTDTPLPGDLPYAPFDNRVIEHLAMRDKLKAWDKAQAKPWTERQSKVLAPHIVASERKALEIEARWALYRWLEGQVKQGVEAALADPRFNASDLPAGDRHFDRDEETELRSFIEETSTEV